MTRRVGFERHDVFLSLKKPESAQVYSFVSPSPMSVDTIKMCDVVDTAAPLLLPKGYLGLSYLALQEEQARLKAALKAVKTKLAGHPETMRKLIQSPKVADALVPRLTFLEESRDDEELRKYVTLCLDGTSFRFAQETRHSIFGGVDWQNVDDYQRAGKDVSASLRVKPGKKKPYITHKWSDDVQDEVAGLIEEPDEETYQECLVRFQKDIDMPLLDLEAAFVAFSVFYQK